MSLFSYVLFVSPLLSVFIYLIMYLFRSLLFLHFCIYFSRPSFLSAVHPFCIPFNFLFNYMFIDVVISFLRPLSCLIAFFLLLLSSCLRFVLPFVLSLSLSLSLLSFTRSLYISVFHDFFLVPQYYLIFISPSLSLYRHFFMYSYFLFIIRT